MSKAYYTQEEVSKIKQARLLEDRGVTHYAGCYDGGPKHYECALLEVKRLRSESEAHMNPSDKYEQIKDIKRLNPVELEATVVHHEQQIKDLAAHLLELKQLVTPMMEFKTPTKVFGPNLEQVLNAAGFYRKKEWVGLTEEEKHDCYLKIDVWSRCVEAIEAKLKDKNTCSLKT